jgi:hypothetical protein
MSARKDVLSITVIKLRCNLNSVPTPMCVRFSNQIIFTTFICKLWSLTSTGIPERGTDGMRRRLTTLMQRSHERRRTAKVCKIVSPDINNNPPLKRMHMRQSPSCRSERQRGGSGVDQCEGQLHKSMVSILLVPCRPNLAAMSNSVLGHT